MPAPTNISAGTAIDITSLPYSNTQTVDDAGTTYTVWYKYTFDIDKVIGIFCWGTAPYTTKYDTYGPNSSVIHTDVAQTQNRPIQLQGAAGDTYYIKIAPSSGNPSPAVLDIAVEEAPSDAIVDGDIAINDDTSGFPCVILDSATGAVRRFEFPVCAGEQGDSLLTNPPAYLLADGNDFPKVVLYDTDFAEVTRITPAGTDADPLIRANKTLDLFYVMSRDSGTGEWIVQSVDKSGTTATITTITGSVAPSLRRSFCINSTATKVYVDTSGAIKVWNIAGVSFDADLAAAIASYTPRDILELNDGTVLVLYVNVGTGDVQVKHYDTGGSTLNTYALGTSTATLFQHLAYSTDNSTTFWAWTHGTGGNAGKTRLQNITVATGVAGTDYYIPEFETGAYQVAAANPPLARFGPSFSCPVFLVATAPAFGTIVVNKVTIPNGLTQSFAFTAGGGLSPGSFNLLDGGTRTFTSVPAGSGYSITETPDSRYDTTYEVSNDSPHTNIEVAGDETVTVTVTNVLKSAIGSGIYKIVPGSNKRNDTLWNANTSGTTDVAIPDPYVITGYIGD